jgi:hypothetical protein
MTGLGGYDFFMTVTETPMAVSSGKKSFSVTLPQGTYEILKEWAAAKDWNVSQAARNIIAERLGKEYEVDPEQLRGSNSEPAEIKPKARKRKL